MKKAVAALVVYSITTVAFANVSKPHPVYGKWTWTRAENNCTEVYDYRPDNTSVVTSADEIGESQFTITEKPDLGGFYRMVDIVTKSNGKAGCDGSPGGSPVGDTATIYIFIHPTRDEMVMCQEPSFRACFGPLRRISK
ncbi:MAG: hypothetical protein LBV61_08220 [Burkholderiaceae bacterium]|jgi:hypothetical protein|nr:hypothetical protein [Burkholderiaceae bacterium]